MRLLHIIDDLTVGGAQKLLVDLCEVCKNSIDITVVALRECDSQFRSRLVSMGIKYHALASAGSNLYNPAYIVKLIPYIKRTDVVHVHLFPANYLVSFTSLFEGKPIVYTEHSTNNSRRSHPVLRPLERLVYSRFNKIVSISNSAELNLKQWIKASYEDKRFVVIENGVSLSTFFPSSKPEDSHTLIMVSRFSKMKDQKTVIRAIPYLNSNIRVQFVGSGTGLEECENLASELRVMDRVEFLGDRSDIPQLLSKSSISVQSSIWEGFGLTAVEAMAAGLPVVVTDVDGLKQVVAGYGKLFEVGNYKQLAQLINEIDNSPILYDTLKSKSLERAKDFDIKKTARRYLDVYDELINRA